MKVLKWLVILVVLLLAGAFAYGLTLPNTSHVERMVKIDAPACVVYAQLDNFRNYNKWSPWEQYDPNMQHTVEGPMRGAGARQSWSGNDQVGTGSQEILEATPCTRLKSKLVFGGFEYNQYTATFVLAPEGQATQVTWIFDGEFGGNLLQQVLSRYFSLVVEDALIQDFDRGLANLKKLAEGLPKTDFAGLVVAEVQVAPVAIAAVNGRSTTESADIGNAYSEAYAKIMGFVKANDLKEAGPPIAITRKWDDQANVFEFEAGIPVDRTDVAPAEGEVRLSQTHGGKVLKVTHTGPYESLPRTYEMLKAFVAAYGYEKAGDEWEEYVSDPGQVAAAELVTVIYYPVK